MTHTLKYIAFGALCASLTFAQTTTAPTPVNMIQRQVQHLTKELSLTSAQQAQATTIFTTEQNRELADHGQLEDCAYVA